MPAVLEVLFGLGHIRAVDGEAAAFAHLDEAVGE